MTADTPPTSEPNPDDPGPGRLEKLHDWVTSPGGRVLRYLLVLVIVGLAVYLSLTGWFQVCEVVDSEKDGITRTCSGPNLTSAGVLAAVIFVLLLLWPDLSEFSAFGVTLKKLVQKVEEKVTETRDKTTLINDKTTHIDDTTTETRSRLESLQSAVTTQGGDISERLSLIQSDLTSLSTREAERDAAPPYSEAVPFPSTGTPLAPSPRWDAFDRDNFVHACEELFDAETLESILASLDESVDRQTWERAAAAGIDTGTTTYAGLTLELFRSFRGHWDRIRHDQPHARQVDGILRSIEWMLLAMVGGRRVDDNSLRFAAAALVLFHRYEL